MEEKNYKDRLTRIYKFLKEYNDIKNPVLINIKEQLWSQWLEELPVHETIKWFTTNNEEEDFVMSLRRPELTEIPNPPSFLRGYYKTLVEEYGFNHKWIRTDYNFENVKEAEELIRFFFGEELAQRVRDNNLVCLPECAGIWWLQQ